MGKGKERKGRAYVGCLASLLTRSVTRRLSCDSITAQESLQNVKKGELVDGDGLVKVVYADKWLETRRVVSRML